MPCQNRPLPYFAPEAFTPRHECLQGRAHDLRAGTSARSLSPTRTRRPFLPYQTIDRFQGGVVNRDCNSFHNKIV